MLTYRQDGEKEGNTMKVKFTAEQKRFITVEELPAVQEIIAMMKEDTGLKEYAGMAARIVEPYSCCEILKVEAEIARNNRVFNRYSDTSGMLDIWLTVYAFDSFKGFYTIGAYLSDIWEANGENSDELRSDMYIRKFTEKK